MSQYEKHTHQPDLDSLETALTLTPTGTLVHSDQLNPIPWLAPIYEIIGQYDLYPARQLPRWRTFRHLLNTDRLMIPKRAQPVFHRDGMTLAIVLGHDRRRRCGGEERLGRDGTRIVVRPRVEMRGRLAVVDGFEHLGSDERACEQGEQVVNQNCFASNPTGTSPRIRTYTS